MKYRRTKTLGLMSGTSLDGVDAAILDTDGETIFGFGATHFRPYSADERQILYTATQAALKWNFTGPPPNIFSHAEAIVHQAHIEAVQTLMDKRGEVVSLIGFHGQTVLHRPPECGRNGKTLQLGDGQVLADTLGIDVVYDFRTADMKAGGQGAPLAPLYHKALLKRANISNAAVLNIGGVSNITLMGNDGVIRASDCGPGNGPLDAWMEKCGLGAYDKDGKCALSGTPDFALIEVWLRADFFTKPVPKSADRWDFDVLADMTGLSPQDGAATLAAYCAFSVEHTLDKYTQDIDIIIICGGGRKNSAIMAALKEQCKVRVVVAETIGWNGDDLEAQAFAFLAARSAQGLSLSTPETTGVPTPMTGGCVGRKIDYSIRSGSL